MLRTLAPTLSIIIAALLYFFFTQPKMDDIAVIQNDVDAYTAAISSYENFHNLLNQQLNQMNERSAEERKKLDTMLPVGVDDAKLIVDLEAMAKKHNLLFGNVSSAKGSAESAEEEVLYDEEGMEISSSQSKEYKVVSTDIGFDLVGTYDQLKDFLTDLEKSLTIFDVTKLDFASGEGQFQQYSLTVRTYSLSQ